MFRPDEPLAPLDTGFAEPWHAQALALADALVQTGRVTPGQWAEALGAALSKAADRGLPDTPETYYGAVLDALEAVADAFAGIDGQTRAARRADWEEAFRRTPHGHPVHL